MIIIYWYIIFKYNLKNYKKKLNLCPAIDLQPARRYYTMQAYHYRCDIIWHAFNAERKGYRMKIEKVNENQIRCTLTREDLASRELKISELAYGTEKAKTLFRDMMRQANFEFGFEAEDIPLMIEAIPLNAECIVLIITKVEDPDELDTRFSRFAPSVTEDSGEDEEFDTDNTDEVMELFRQLQTDKAEPANAPAAEESPAKDKLLSRIYAMASLQQTIDACRLISPAYNGFSSLFKDSDSGVYYLSLTAPTEQLEEFNRVCNTLSEYGCLKHGLPGSRNYLFEHCETLIRDNTVQSLGTI